MHPSIPLILLLLFILYEKKEREIFYEEIGQNPPAEIVTRHGHFVLAFRNPWTMGWERLPAGYDPPPVALMRGYRGGSQSVLVGYVNVAIVHEPRVLRQKSDGEVVWREDAL